MTPSHPVSALQQISMLCYTHKDWDKASSGVPALVEEMLALFGPERCVGCGRSERSRTAYAARRAAFLSSSKRNPDTSHSIADT